MTKILIVDDEVHCRNVLVKLITDFKNENIIIESANDISQAFEKIHSFIPDIVLLDIRMNEGTGFDLLDKVDSSKFQTIFTTAYDEYAIKAFEYSAVHYLLKPIDKNELKLSLERCELSFVSVNNQKVSEIKNLIVSAGILELKVDINEICHIHAEGSYSRIHLTNGRKILTSKNIGKYDELLPPLFFRIHRSYLVNTHQIKQVNFKTHRLDTHSSLGLPISKRKKAVFKKVWNNL